MVEHIFQTVAQRGQAIGIDVRTHEREAQTWYRKTAQSMQSISPAQLMRDPNNTTTNLTGKDIGRMLMFVYDPKLKTQLPFYDTFPLIFPLNMDKNGMLGINLHYLPPVFRAQLMDALYQTINNKSYDETTKLNITYNMLKNASRYKYFKPCIKRYLWPHVRSKYLNIPPTAWDFALMLPTQRFQKASAQSVWEHSTETVK